MLVIRLITSGNEYFRRGRLINKVVLPLNALLIICPYIERVIATKAPVHVNYLPIRNTEVFRNQGHLIGMHIADLQYRDLVFCRSQLEKELLLACGGAYFHKRPGSQDVILYRGPDPAHRVTPEAKTSVGFKALECLHQANVGF